MAYVRELAHLAQRELERDGRGEPGAQSLRDSPAPGSRLPGCECGQPARVPGSGSGQSAAAWMLESAATAERPMASMCLMSDPQHPPSTVSW